MSFKWDEKLIVRFFAEYEKHPCLWNPYNKNYYDCLAKNEAIKKIIQYLNIPTLTVADCLQQIKVIKEKYGKEQQRTIQGLQSHQPYKSPFPWYDLIARMLIKVIDDEERCIPQRLLKTSVSEISTKRNAHFNIPSTRPKLSNNVDTLKKKTKSFTDSKIKTSVCYNMFNNNNPEKDINSGDIAKEITKRRIAKDKKVEHERESCFQDSSSSYVEIEENNVGRDEGKTLRFNYKYKENNKYPRNGHPTVYPCTLMKPINKMAKEDKEAQLLQCPSCGWENPEYEKTERKTVESVKVQTKTPLAIVYCPDYMNFANVMHYNEQIENVPCPSFFASEHDKDRLISDLNKYKKVLNDMCATSQDIQETKQQQTISKTSTEICTKETQVSPEQRVIQIGTNTVEYRDKEIQNSICIDDAKTTPSCLKYSALSQTMAEVEVNTETIKETKSKHCVKYVPTQQRLKDSWEEPTKKTQNTICISCADITELFVKCPASSPKLIETGINTVDTDNKLQNTICIQSKDLETIEKCVKDNVRTKKICSRGSATKINACQPIITHILIHCLDRILQLTDETKICAVASFLLDKIKSHNSKEIICDPCKFSMKRKRRKLDNSSTELGNTSNLSSTKEVEINNAVGVLTETFLEVVKCALDLDSKNMPIQNDMCKCISQESCAVDISKMLNKIEKCAVRILQLDTNTSNEQGQSLSELSSRFNAESTRETTSSINSKNIQTINVTSNEVTDEDKTTPDENHVTLFKASSQQPVHHNGYSSETDTTFLDSVIERKVSVEDKEVNVKSDRNDIGTTKSLSNVFDTETQSDEKSVSDACVETKDSKAIENKITTGTQKRDPLLIRVVKYHNNQEAVMSDKEVCSSNANCIEKNKSKSTVICPSSRSKCKNTCAEYYCAAPVCFDNISETTCQKQMNSRDLSEGMISYPVFECDKECKDRKLFDREWTKVNIAKCKTSPTNSISKRLPLCVRLHKINRCKRKNDKVIIN